MLTVLTAARLHAEGFGRHNLKCYEIHYYHYQDMSDKYVIIYNIMILMCSLYIGCLMLVCLQLPIGLYILCSMLFIVGLVYSIMCLLISVKTKCKLKCF